VQGGARVGFIEGLSVAESQAAVLVAAPREQRAAGRERQRVLFATGDVAGDVAHEAAEGGDRQAVGVAYVARVR